MTDQTKTWAKAARVPAWQAAADPDLNNLIDNTHAVRLPGGRAEYSVIRITRGDRVCLQDLRPGGRHPKMVTRWLPEDAQVDLIAMPKLAKTWHNTYLAQVMLEAGQAALIDVKTDALFVATEYWPVIGGHRLITPDGQSIEDAPGNGLILALAIEWLQAVCPEAVILDRWQHNA